MTMLAALAKAYASLPDAPIPGYATQKIGLLVSLHPDGAIAGLHDLRSADKKRTARSLSVPAPVKRTAGILPNTLWDKPSYALGLSATPTERTAREHAAFVERQRELLGGTNDPGLVAFLRFLDSWTPERASELDLPPDALDQNVIFGLEEDRLRNVYLHDRPAARALFARDESGETNHPLCLVTGERGPVARLHPSIKGVYGGQSSGGAIVSFNLDAFESYGHEQGANAPVSESAAAAYTGALNHFLQRDSGHRTLIGDTSTVFWADTTNGEISQLATAIFSAFVAGPPKVDAGVEAKKVGAILERLREGQAIAKVEPELAKGVRFYVLGLTPNAARVSVRFWVENEFAHIARNMSRFFDDMALDPPPPGPPPAIWQYVAETAARGKSENVPPNLSGEWTRAILAGHPYPMTLLSTILMRIRADGEVNGRRVAILKALLRRNFQLTKEEAPVALDPTNSKKGYLLGRLFATYEQAQSAALGRSVNATIKDKFYGAASAQPRKVFPQLDKGSANHLSKLGKSRPGQRVNIEKTITAIMDLMDPNAEPFPASLGAADQALFGLGYYHQRAVFFTKSPAASEASETETSE